MPRQAKNRATKMARESIRSEGLLDESNGVFHTSLSDETVSRREIHEFRHDQFDLFLEDGPEFGDGTSDLLGLDLALGPYTALRDLQAVATGPGSWYRPNIRIHGYGNGGAQ